ncbi:hypothetical protein B0T24DRAFT_24614 [Lasiosphaeria ovina]|uniref:Uncharacterized protein n=1 Tax=Lasiosphaeria ovina TaxID=92902 RepID=A0AAE0TX89_9PEZI|nr:hypothetical protein B0T24DRAFT_24614 [Lasiosphaeria ovina]
MYSIMLYVQSIGRDLRALFAGRRLATELLVPVLFGIAKLGTYTPRLDGQETRPRRPYRPADALPNSPWWTEAEGQGPATPTSVAGPGMMMRGVVASACRSGRLLVCRAIQMVISTEVGSRKEGSHWGRAGFLLTGPGWWGPFTMGGMVLQGGEGVQGCRKPQPCSWSELPGWSKTRPGVPPVPATARYFALSDHPARAVELWAHCCPNLRCLRQYNDCSAVKVGLSEYLPKTPAWPA